MVFLFPIKFYLKGGATPLRIAAQQGNEQVVQLLLEKGKGNVDLATKVILLILTFSFSFFNVKYGITPLFIAACNGHEQIVQLLLEKGNPNTDLPMEVLLLFMILIF